MRLSYASDDEAVFGLPMFLAMFSISIAFFNSTIANEEQLIRAGSWITAVLTIVMFVLFLPRAINGTLWNFWSRLSLVLRRALIFYSIVGGDRRRT
jgi:hypothetical protein